MYIITVLFKIQAAHYADFLEAMTNNAQTSLSIEPECHQFDVCSGGDIDNPTIFLYEVYSTKEDFQAHLVAPHFLEFNTLTTPWVVEKIVNSYNRV